MFTATKLPKHHKKQHSRTTDKRGILPEEYQDMAIRSLDNTRKEKQKLGTKQISEKKPTPRINPVSEPSKVEVKADDKITVPPIDSSINSSTLNVEENLRDENPDPSVVSSKDEREDDLSSANQKTDNFSLPEPSQPAPSHHENISTDTNAPNLEEKIREPKQEAQDEKISNSRLQHKEIKYEKQSEVGNDYYARIFMKYYTPWLQAADPWTKLYSGYVENALVLMQYWLGQFSTIWLYGYRTKEKDGIGR